MPGEPVIAILNSTGWTRCLSSHSLISAMASASAVSGFSMRIVKGGSSAIQRSFLVHKGESALSAGLSRGYRALNQDGSRISYVTQLTLSEAASETTHYPLPLAPISCGTPAARNDGRLHVLMAHQATYLKETPFKQLLPRYVKRNLHSREDND